MAGAGACEKSPNSPEALAGVVDFSSLFVSGFDGTSETLAGSGFAAEVSGFEKARATVGGAEGVRGTGMLLSLFRKSKKPNDCSVGDLTASVLAPVAVVAFDSIES